MGIELELAVLLALSIIGQSTFAVFEVETPIWHKLLKWSILVALTLGLYPIIGHGSVAVPLLIGIIGASMHFFYCNKHQIDPFRATPRRTYYQLRKWSWPE